MIFNVGSARIGYNISACSGPDRGTAKAAGSWPRVAPAVPNGRHLPRDDSRAFLYTPPLASARSRQAADRRPSRSCRRCSRRARRSCGPNKFPGLHRTAPSCGSGTIAGRPGIRCDRIRCCRFQFILGQPAARGDLGFAGHLRRDGLCHALRQIHDVVRWHLGEFGRRPSRQLVWLVAWPIGALVVVIGAQKGMHALRTIPHVGVGLARRIVPLIVLAGSCERGEIGVDVAATSRGGAFVGGVEGQSRRAAEGRAHQSHRLKHIRPYQRTVCGNRRPEVVADDGLHGAVSERRNQPQGIAPQVQKAKRAEVAVIVGVPARGASIAALVWRNHVIAGRRQRQHHFAPAVGELGKAMQQQEAWAVLAIEPGLQHVHAQAVDVVDEARANAGRKGFNGRFCHRPLRCAVFREYGTC